MFDDKIAQGKNDVMNMLRHYLYSILIEVKHCNMAKLR